jgi:hypothetical protein
MTIDVYEMCLGGVNKKIKFCECGKDMLGDLNKLVAAIKGGQKAAALGQVNRLLESHGPRACLLALKGSAQLQMGNVEELGKIAATFCQNYPDNPIALSFAAIVAATRNEVAQMLDQIQGALDAAIDGAMHEATYAAIGITGRVLVQNGHIVPAIGYLTLQAALGPEKDDSAWNILRSIFAAQSVPNLLKFSPEPMEPPEGAPWVEELAAADELAARGRWRRAVAALKDLDQRYPDQPAILAALARLQGWVNQLEDAGATLHRLAAHPSLALDQAVEIEAMAQMMSSYEQQTVDEMLRTYAVQDSQQMMQCLLSEQQVVPIPVDLNKMGGEGTPPPKGAFWLLDRITPASGKDLKLHEIPNILGEMYLYGRETDREARLEFVTVKSADYQRKLEVLSQLVGEHCGDLLREEPIGHVVAEAAAMSWKWRLPEDTPRSRREELLKEKRREVNLNVWPETPLPALDGKRPVDVAGDPAYRVRLLAAILIQEDNAERSRITFDFNELRSKLNLPVREEISLADLPTSQLSPMQLHLVKLDSLTNEQLLEIFEVAVAYNLSHAGLRLGGELLRRPNFVQRAERPKILNLMIPLSGTTDQVIEFIRMAYEDVLATGQSIAPWLLRELEVRLLVGELERANELLVMIQSQHIREPGVAEAFYTLLVRFGIITPDGKPRAAAQGGAPQPPGSPMVTSDQPQAPVATDGIWTPGSPQAPQGAGAKPKLWVPGRD